jgi:serine protease Do
MDQQFKNILVASVLVSIITSSIFGGIIGFWAGTASQNSTNAPNWLMKTVDVVNRQMGMPAFNQTQNSAVKTVDQEGAVVDAVQKVSPAVVSIIITKNLPIIERYYSDPSGGNSLFQQFFGNGFGVPQYRQKGTQKQEVGGGTGFIVSSDGYVITNNHVVADEQADYTVLMNDSSRHVAKVLARDAASDLAVLKIDGNNYTTVDLGESSDLKAGQTVIAIGNALGEFRNTVSTGVISGLARSVTAGGADIGTEDLVGVIQTDASINPGNSGGPLLNISGQVIGINTAMAQGAENIGFAIPVNEVRNIYDNVRKNGRIVKPWLGLRFQIITKDLADANKLPYDYGALVAHGQDTTDLAVIPGSPADKAGIAENDIILEVDGKKINDTNPLNKVIAGMSVGDEITLKVYHKGQTKDIKIKLEEMK